MIVTAPDVDEGRSRRCHRPFTPALWAPSSRMMNCAHQTGGVLSTSSERQARDHGVLLATGAKSGTASVSHHISWSRLYVIALLRHDQPARLLIVLSIDFRAGRRCVGRAVVESIEREAKRRGCFAIVLYSLNHGELGHAIYHALGYDAIGRRFVKRLGDDNS